MANKAKTEEQKYTVRQLKSKDIFKMSKILKKLDLKFEVKSGTSQAQLGAELISQLLGNLDQAEKEISNFLGELVGISGEEYLDLPIAVTIDVIEQFRNLDGVGDFLKLANK